MNLHLKPTEVLLAAWTVVEEARETAEGSGAVLSVDIAADFDQGEAVLADPERLRICLELLLSDALRDAKPRSSVRLTGRRAGDEIRLIVIRSSEEPGDELPQVVADACLRAAGGWIELPEPNPDLVLAREVVESMGGCLLVYEHPGKPVVWGISLAPAGVADA